MFAGVSDAEQRARRVAHALADHATFLSHGRHISRDQAKALGGAGLLIEDLETNQDVQDAVLSVFHATSHTFNATTAVKLIENHAGRAFVGQVQVFTIGGDGQPPAELDPQRGGLPLAPVTESGDETGDRPGPRW